MEIVGNGAEVINKDFQECLEAREGIHLFQHGVLERVIREVDGVGEEVHDDVACCFSDSTEERG